MHNTMGMILGPSNFLPEKKSKKQGKHGNSMALKLQKLQNKQGKNRNLIPYLNNPSEDIPNNALDMNNQFQDIYKDTDYGGNLGLNHLNSNLSMDQSITQ